MGSDAGTSTCPMCKRTWTVTPRDDCMMPACGHFGFDYSADNPNRPCHSCGTAHAWKCRGHGEVAPKTIELTADLDRSPGQQFDDLMTNMATVNQDWPVPKLFGSKWDGTPAGDMLERVPVPVDEICVKCFGPISATQSGLMIANADADHYNPWHRVCLALDVLGILPTEEEL